MRVEIPHIVVQRRGNLYRMTVVDEYGCLDDETRSLISDRKQTKSKIGASHSVEHLSKRSEVIRLELYT